jgi:hypothetical protein
MKKIFQDLKATQCETINEDEQANVSPCTFNFLRLLFNLQTATLNAQGNQLTFAKKSSVSALPL